MVPDFEQEAISYSVRHWQQWPWTCRQGGKFAIILIFAQVVLLTNGSSLMLHDLHLSFITGISSTTVCANCLRSSVCYRCL